MLFETTASMEIATQVLRNRLCSAVKH